jgi:hypothetical protein
VCTQSLRDELKQQQKDAAAADELRYSTTVAELEEKVKESKYVIANLQSAKEGVDEELQRVRDRHAEAETLINSQAVKIEAMLVNWQACIGMVTPFLDYNAGYKHTVVAMDMHMRSLSMFCKSEMLERQHMDLLTTLAGALVRKPPAPPGAPPEAAPGAPAEAAPDAPAAPAAPAPPEAAPAPAEAAPAHPEAAPDALAAPAAPAPPEAAPAPAEAAPAHPEAAPAHPEAAPAHPEAAPAHPEAAPAHPEAAPAEAAPAEAAPGAPAHPEAAPVRPAAAPGAPAEVAPGAPDDAEAAPDDAEVADTQEPPGSVELAVVSAIQGALAANLGVLPTLCTLTSNGDRAAWADVRRVKVRALLAPVMSADAQTVTLNQLHPDKVSKLFRPRWLGPDAMVAAKVLVAEIRHTLEMLDKCKLPAGHPLAPPDGLPAGFSWGDDWAIRQRQLDMIKAQQLAQQQAQQLAQQQAQQLAQQQAQQQLAQQQAQQQQAQWQAQQQAFQQQAQQQAFQQQAQQQAFQQQAQWQAQQAFQAQQQAFQAQQQTQQQAFQQVPPQQQGQ